MGARDRDRGSSTPSVTERVEQETTLETLTVVLDGVRSLSSEQENLRSSLGALSEEIRYSKSSSADSEFSERLGDVTERLWQLTSVVNSIGATLSDEREVQLGDGTSVTKSDLDALTLARKTHETMEGWSSDLVALRKQVEAKSQVRVDEVKVARVITDRLEARIDTVITEATTKLDDAVAKSLEARMTDMTSTISEATAKLEEANTKLRETERRAEAMASKLSIGGIGRLAAATVPLLMLCLLGALMFGVAGHALGVGPLYGWAWESFAAAGAWWQKLLIALATIGTTVGMVFLASRGAKWLIDYYKGYS